MNRQQAQTLRSLMFVPATSPQFIEKAHTRGADGIIVDLEDSIAPAMKQQARAALGAAVRAIAAHGLPVFVRVNNDPALLRDDLDAAVQAPIAGVFLPKAEDPAQIAEVAGWLSASEAAHGVAAASTSLVLLLESPLAIHQAGALARSHARVIAFGFGSEDYATLLGVRPTLEAMRMPAYSLALAARAHGLAAWGLAGSIGEFSDLDLFRAMASTARDAGFTGSISIHPKQVAVLNEVFGVSAAEAQEAAEIVAAFDQALAEGKAAVAFKGKMLDIPVVERARQVVEKAKRASA
ncbi:MAG TPA: CoA ester lyase [Quisquiliibacterium sp.]|nr:CoA ester lyase [Quisquiliibacterium sp.]HPA91896.1 CoA ester lyase [Quisquiliibacterium sp.]HQN13489.1 CoA ester lyase [Quisquiliibacterium sp.]